MKNRNILSEALNLDYSKRSPNQRWALFVFYVRHKLKYSRKELADKIKVSTSTITYWENGLVLPHHQSIHEICKLSDYRIDLITNYLNGEYDLSIDSGIALNLPKQGKIETTSCSCIEKTATSMSNKELIKTINLLSDILNQRLC